MSIELAENQHEVLSLDESLSLVFGKVGTTYYTLTYPLVEEGDSRAGDTERIREDGVAFGEDFLTGKTVLFELGVDTSESPTPHVDNEDAIEALEGTWKHEDFRSGPGHYAILRSHMVPGRVRRAYGRPRRFSPVTDRLTHKGYSTAMCDFAVPDGTWYDDVAETASAALAPATASGLTTPLVTPLVTGSVETTVSSALVGGTKPTWMTVTIHGPTSGAVSNPVVKVGGLVVAFNGTIPAGRTVTFDPRPWVRSCVDDAGGSWAGRLTYSSTPMKLCKVKPGLHVVSFGGSDPSGTAWAEVSWRNRYQRW